MKFHTDETLQFWRDCDYQTQRAKKSNRARMQLIPEILRSHEEQGNVMRYLRVEGEIAWRATLLMPPKLADLQRDADEDLADWP